MRRSVIGIRSVALHGSASIANVQLVGGSLAVCNYVHFTSFLSLPERGTAPYALHTTTAEHCLETNSGPGVSGTWLVSTLI